MLIRQAQHEIFKEQFKQYGLLDAFAKALQRCCFDDNPHSRTISLVSFIYLFLSGRLSVMTAKENPMASENSYQDFFSTIEAKEASTNEIFKKVGYTTSAATFFFDFAHRISSAV